jgi:dienelactone hydrolase
VSQTATIVALKAFLLIGLSFGLMGAKAQSPLPEEVVMIKKPGLFTLELETTIFKPPGSGPFPLVVINHGKEGGDPRFQGRSKYPAATRFFLSRGYVVAIPMRQGFSKSTGIYIAGGCNVESNGVAQAEDVKGTIAYLTEKALIDPARILVMGQSHGGLTTMAFGATNYPGVLGLVNFAGGLRQDDCPGWESVLARAFGNYGKQTKIPSLWFYGDNDSFWKKDTWQAMYSRYSEAIAPNGSYARMVAFGSFVTDAHRMFGHPLGPTIWAPELLKFVTELGLPNAIEFAQFTHPSPQLRPPPSLYATLSQIEAVPFLKDTGRKAYERFISGELPRAFAISPSGAWGLSLENEDSNQRALSNCNKSTSKQDCKLYAVDEDVVWIN